ncbi:MAG: nucleoside hydrolase [Candidatus Hodarchaeales archaeon]|jgi:pyrimidine-specific ribonucleoside hydrolase
MRKMFSPKTALIVGFLITCAIPTVIPTSPTLEEIPIIIDTDVAPDDIGAILYLLKHPSISVRAITVSCGVTYVNTGVNNMLRLLDYLGNRNIPVAAGKNAPLYTNNTFPAQWREGSEGFYGLDLPLTDLQPSEMNASELIIETINASTENMMMVTLGPLTNIAIALQSDPSIKDSIELIDMMGGAVNVPGNVGYEYPEIPNLVAEWNMYIDPHAADIVFKSGVPIMLVPLDATNEVPQTEKFRTNLENVMKTPEAQVVHEFVIPGMFFWDQLTAVALTNPTIVTLEQHCIEVVIDNKNQTGRTKSIEEDQLNAQVAVNADASKFEELFIEIINQDTSSEQGVWGLMLTPFLVVTFILSGWIRRKKRG